jgi:hypothetical protein
MKIICLVMSGKFIVLEFDQRNFGRQPISGTLILHVTRFATLQIVGFEPREAKLNDLTIGIAFLGFYI